MRHRLRSLVWRELPYSVRQSILGVLHAFDDFEDFWRRLWRSLEFSPAWLFVAGVGTLGVVLTMLLFIMLTQELLADHSPVAIRRPIIEPARLPKDTDLLDSRLCLDVPPPVLADYPADFAHNSGLLMTEYTTPAPSAVPDLTELPELPRIERRPPSRQLRPVEEELPQEPVVAAPVDVPIERLPPRRQPVVEAQPASDTLTQFDEPDLQIDVQAWRQPAAPMLPESQEQIATARSQAGPNQIQQLLDWDPSSPWTWYRERPQVQQNIVAYAGDSRLELEQPDERLWDDFTAWPNRADVALQVELYAPVETTVLQKNRSRLVVRNTGHDAIRRVEVQEPIRLLDQVTDATPPAALKDSTLYRELNRLGAGREKSLEVNWVAPSQGDRHHEARVVAEAFVAASVDVTRPAEPVVEQPRAPVMEAEPEPRYEPVPEPKPEPRRPPARTAPIIVEPPEDFGPPATAEQPPAAPVKEVPPAVPAIACRVSGKDRIPVQGVAEFSIEVVNTGDTPLSGVYVWADLPENLLHRYGNRLQMQLGNLAPGQRRQAVLRVIGNQIGISRARIQAVSAETQSEDADAYLAVTPSASQTPAKREPAGPGCACPCPQVSFRMPQPRIQNN